MPMGSARRLGAALAVAALVAAGCGSDDSEGAPSACLGSSEAYLQALQVAPAAVRLEGEVPVSDCLTPEQESGELANVGQELIVAATKLNNEARENPDGDTAALQLGYLVGAVSKGADSIHTDLVRRINSAAQFSESGHPLPPDFQQAFGQGYAAGLQSG